MRFLAVGRFLILSVLSVCLFLACSDGAKKLEKKPRTKLKIAKTKVVEHEKLSLFRVPGPTEQFIRIKSVFSKFTPALMSIPKETDSLVLGALHTGYLLTDLAYAGSFSRKNESLQILNELKNFENKLGVNDSTIPQFLALSPKIKGYADSLKKITSEHYQLMMIKLRANKKPDLVTFVRIGSWVEMMSLLIGTEKAKGSESKMDSFLSAQKLVVENLLLSLMEEKNRVEVEFFRGKLTEILECFDGMVAKTETPVLIEQKDVYVLKGGRKVDISTKDKEKLKLLINDLKNYGVNEVD